MGSGTSWRLFPKYYDNTMYEVETGGTCRTCGIDNSSKTPKKSDSFGDLNVDWRIISN